MLAHLNRYVCPVILACSGAPTDDNTIRHSQVCFDCNATFVLTHYGARADAFLASASGGSWGASGEMSSSARPLVSG